MRSVVLIIVAAHIAFFTGGLVADDRSAAQNEITRLKREYADVLALQGTAKSGVPGHRQNSSCETQDCGRSDGGEWRILFQQRALARWFTLPPDRKTRLKTLFYEFDASGLIAAGFNRRGCSSYPNEAE